MQDKTNLLGYSQKSLEVFFKDIDEPAFRAKQLLKWVHQKGELDFRMMTAAFKITSNPKENDNWSIKTFFYF